MVSSGRLSTVESAQCNARSRAVSFRLETWYHTSAEGSSWGRKSTTHSPALTVDSLWRRKPNLAKE